MWYCGISIAYARAAIGNTIGLPGRKQALVIGIGAVTKAGAS
jgi:hypothetical protein